MHQNGSEPTDKGDFKTRPRPVPPPGAIASASLPGYRRAGVGAGCVDPLPPTAPPRHPFRRLQTGASAARLTIDSLTYATSTLASPIVSRPTAAWFRHLRLLPDGQSPASLARLGFRDLRVRADGKLLRRLGS